MNRLIAIAINRPIAVVAAVLMAVMFGLLALTTIPIQLIPDVRKPILTLTTNWYGAAPQEIEREIVNRQEEVLRGLEGLTKITSSSQDGRAQVTLEFGIGTNMDRALLLVSNRLDRVSDYPDEADEPTIATSSSDDSPIAWFILKRNAGNVDKPIHTYLDFVEDNVVDVLERIPGVSRLNVYGGGEREMRVNVNPERMSQFGLTVPDVVDALRRENISISGGDVDEGKRRYVVRTDGDFTTPEEVADVVLLSNIDPDSGRMARVFVRDIGTVGFAHKKPVATIRNLGEAAIAFNIVRESGANVISLMRAIKVEIARLAEGPIAAADMNIEQVYDETLYINSAIDLVEQNIVVGGLLAAAILLLFLRSLRATLVISLSIPVSVIGSFVAMAALGRSLNVVSLAGIAFAVGMVVDAAIVVLENIYRHRQLGRAAPDAAFQGANQVWGAVLVSALTTVMVFVPILIMDLEVGQLFRDIAVAISVSVILSLLVSITVIPALSQRLLAKDTASLTSPLRIPVIDGFARAFSGVILGFTRLVAGNKLLAVATVIVVCGGTAVATWAFLPKLDYLPTGNRNLILGVILPPPGYNLATMEKIAERLEDETKPLWSRRDGAVDDPDGPPLIESFFFVAFRGQTIVGARAADAARVRELIPILSAPVFREPGTYGFMKQRSLFGRGLAGSRAIELHISGPELEPILNTALNAMGLVGQALPRREGHQARPLPGVELGAPEVRVLPDSVRLGDAEVSPRTLGLTVDAFNDGLRVAEITVDGKRIDLVLMGDEDHINRTQGIAHLPVVTPSGRILPVNALASVDVTAGPTEIRHVERERTVTIEVTPGEEIPLEAALEIIRLQVMDKLQAAGLPPGVQLHLSGTADQLSETWNHIVVDLFVAVAIVYLVMAVLFESFIYPLIIVLSVPLAAAGGIAGLSILNLYTFQALDMLTMLGFIILIGIVVNNAILLVHQTLYHQRHDLMSSYDAILEATRNRIRPIFMSTLTSVFGMIPLVVFPGAGSELYRGLGSVVVGGLALSAVLTLLIIPPLLSLASTVMGAEKAQAPAKGNVSHPAPAE